MTIVLVGGQSIPGIGGIEAYVFNMAKALHSQGHNVVIICCDDKSHTNTIDNVKIIYKKCPKSNMIGMPLLFLKSLGYIIKNKRTIDVVNFQSIFFAFLPGWITQLFGCKVCYTIHSLAEDNPKHNRFLMWIIKIIAFVSIWFCGQNILTISKSKAAEIYTRYKKRCTVIPCAVNLPTAHAWSDIINRFNIKKGYYYLTIGRIDPIKNLDILIQAFIQRNNPEFQLVIAGNLSNSYGKHLQDLAKGHKNIIFVGSVIGNDKECLLRECFVNCLISSSEGMPISLLEAMAYGKPCIVSDIPAIHEIIEDSWVQWCNVRDAYSVVNQMTFAEDNYNFTAVRGEKMATYVAKHYTWDNIAKQYISYLQII